jgi:hypothetical protein
MAKCRDCLLKFMSGQVDMSGDVPRSRLAIQHFDCRSKKLQGLA